jgi:hypothetical protein
MTALIAPVVLGSSADGRLELFARGVDGRLYHRWQLQPSDNSAGNWSPGWYSHGSPAGAALVGGPVLRLNSEGRLELFIVGSDGAVYHLWQYAVSGGWNQWIPHGAPPGVRFSPSLALETVDNGRLALFAVGSDGALYSISQIVPSGGWTYWQNHGTPPGTTIAGELTVVAHDDVTLGINGASPERHRLLSVFATAADGTVRYIYQEPPAGAWTVWFSLGQP